jgi:hypothetical protein
MKSKCVLYVLIESRITEVQVLRSNTTDQAHDLKITIIHYFQLLFYWYDYHF